MNKGNNINRRKFFVGAGLSAFALSLAAKSPFNFLKSAGGNDIKSRNIDIKINTNAVMRNKKA